MAKQALTLPNGETILFQLERRPRRTVGLKITDDGLVVHAPKRIFEFQLHQILQQKSNWILNKLQARAENKVEKIEWVDGEHLLYLGQDIQLKLAVGAKKKIHFERYELILHAPEGYCSKAFRASILTWYKKQAVLDFKRRLEIFAAKLGVSTPPLAISNAQSRWGSCSSRGDVRLNWRLLQAPPHIINYVICHELAHLKEMNHSARFWAIVEQLYPDYKRAEKELKALSPQLHRM
jgi:predicted metal-dependent hydrolase